MAEDKKIERTKEEIAATVAKLEAEALKFKAEARKTEAEKREVEASVRTMVARATQDELKLAHLLEGERKRKATDLEHRIYRYSSSVGATTVGNCMEQLTEWHRLDPGCDIEVIFNSGGGAVIDGFELFDFLVDLGNNGHKVTTGCTGMAASMAGILVQAGQERWMSRESWYMIHRAAFGAMGKTFDVEDTVEWIKRIETRILNIFAGRSQLSVATLRKKWDRKDWWIDSDEALKLGLVDSIRASGLAGGTPSE